MRRGSSAPGRAQELAFRCSPHLPPRSQSSDGLKISSIDSLKSQSWEAGIAWMKPPPRDASLPKSRRGQFNQVVVGVAEIEAGGTSGPKDTTFYRYVELLESRLPRGQLVRSDSEADMQPPGAIVGWDESAVAELDGVVGMPATEKQQHLID